MKSIKSILLGVSIVFSVQLSISQNNGPNAPEVAGFEAVDATDMVNLATGDISYVLPLFTVPSPEGGYPINLSYHAGIGYDQESSWIGLGWNLNPGAINRSINGYPDDWKGATVRDVDAFYYETQQVTVGVSDPSGGLDVSIGVNWDSNKSMGGFVSVGYGWSEAGVGGSVSVGYQESSNKFSVNASIGFQSGGYSIGVSGGTGGAGLSAKNKASGIGMSVGLGASGVSGGLSYGKSNAEGYAVGTSVGINFSSNGVSASVSQGNGEGSTSGMSMSFSDTNSSGFSLFIPLGFANITFGYSKTTIKNYNLHEYNIYGPVHFTDMNYHDIGEFYTDDDYNFQNYQNFEFFMDTLKSASNLLTK